MTILNPAELDAALKWPITLGKTATRTTVALMPFSVFDIAGNPGAGTLAIGNTANGVSHTKATAGYPTFPDAPAGKGWYLAQVSGRSAVTVDRGLYDFVYSCGAHAFNANQALTSQPSIDDRLRVAPPWAASTVYRAGDIVTNGSAPIKAYLCVVGGTSAGSGGPTTTASSITDNTCTWMYLSNGLNYAGLEILVEQVTAGTGNQVVTATYSTMGADGVTLTGSRSTGAVGVGAALIVGRMYRLPLQAGDKNVALLTNILGGTATVGTFNVHLARNLGVLWSGSVNPLTDQFGTDRTGLVYIPNNAAIREVQTCGGTTSATGVTSLMLAMG
jgi:hypothetical protein